MLTDPHRYIYVFPWINIHQSSSWLCGPLNVMNPAKVKTRPVSHQDKREERHWEHLQGHCRKHRRKHHQSIGEDISEGTAENASESIVSKNIIESVLGNVIDNATFCSRLADSPFCLEQDTRLLWARNQAYLREVNQRAAHHLHNVLVQGHRVLDSTRLRPCS